MLKKGINKIILLLLTGVLLFGLSPVSGSLSVSADIFDPNPADDPTKPDEPLMGTAPVISAEDEAIAGYGIQRTMHLLESSTAENPNTIRIAAYGQSMIDPNNRWPNYLMNYLQERYPYANIIFNNLAVGGFPTQRLHKMVENDMRAFYPDLVIIDVSGDRNLYEYIIDWIQRNTVSEVISMTDPDQGELFNKKYGTEIIDINKYREIYLQENNIENQAIRKEDGTHLNLQGQTLTYEIVKQFFIYRTTPDFTDNVTYIPITESNWKDGKLTLHFTGNRVEAVLGNLNSHAANVYINDKKPSEYLDCYYYTRIYNYESRTDDPFWSDVGGFYKADLLKIPGIQDWTITFNDVADPVTYGYSIKGSLTGEDGTCKNGNKPFTSDSGIWHITAVEDRHTGNNGLTSGSQYKFSTCLNGCDVLQNPITSSPTNDILLASNLFNPVNILTLEAVDSSKIPDITGIRVYKQGQGRQVEIPAKPKINKLTNKSDMIYSKAPANTIVSITIGKKHYTVQAGNFGEYLLELPKKLAVGTKVTAYAKNYYEISPTVSKTVIPAAPSVNKVTKKSTIIKGKSIPKATITIKYNGKTKTVKAGNKGKYSLKLKKPLQKGTKISLTARIKKLSGETKNIKVK